MIRWPALAASIFLLSAGAAHAQLVVGGALVSASNPLPVVIEGAATVTSIAPVVASNTSNIVAKSSAGNLYEAKASVAASGYIFKFNATSMPGDGAVTAGTATGNYQDCIPVPANSTYSWDAGGGPPESYSAGITIAFSSTGPDTFTHATATIIRARVQ